MVASELANARGFPVGSGQRGRRGTFLLAALVSDEPEDAQEAGAGRGRRPAGRDATSLGGQSERRRLTQPCRCRGGLDARPFEAPVT